LEEEDTQIKQAKMLIYAERAQAGQPLFESSQVVKALAGNRKLSAG